MEKVTRIVMYDIMPDDPGPIAVTVGDGTCQRCTGYFVRVVNPDDPDYGKLAMQFARQ
jgi:hypothetical protein